MPIYEYQCQACGHMLEAIQKFNDASLTQCPACSGNDLKKQVSASTFHLKGEGWYVTDFRNKEGKAAGEKDNKDNSGEKTDADSSVHVKKTETASGQGDQGGALKAQSDVSSAGSKSEKSNAINHPNKVASVTKKNKQNNE